MRVEALDICGHFLGVYPKGEGMSGCTRAFSSGREGRYLETN